MHGSTMGVRTGLSFYTSAAQPATPPYLGSLQSFTPENSGLEKSRIEGGVKICLEFMRWDITSGFQLLRGGKVDGLATAGLVAAQHVCPRRETLLQKQISRATPAFGIVDRENDGNTVHNL